MRLGLFSGRDDRLDVDYGTDALTVRLSGNADVGFLFEALEGLHGEMLGRRIGEVTLDVTGLQPLEPAAVKALIKWAMLQAELDESDRYGIRLRYAEGIAWQKVSLAAIAHLCPYVRLAPIA